MDVLDNGSTFMVPATKILNIRPHTNADKLEIATLLGFDVIIGKGSFQTGDLVLYVPVDSVLPSSIEEKLFENSKIKLNGSRVRACKIRGFVSQGMVAKPELLGVVKPKEGKDYKELLQIQKYEPPVPKFQVAGPKKPKKLENPHFRKYNGITNIKWNPEAFKDEEVVIQIKYHGTHVRFGKAPFVANTLWKKIKKLFGLTPEFEFVYGSNNVELTNRSGKTGFYSSDIYGDCLRKFEAESKLKNNEFVHAEIIGPGIQKGYDYGYKEHHLVIFDVRVMQEDKTQKWLNPEECQIFAKERGFNFVHVLHVGKLTQEILQECTQGNLPEDLGEIREGCVVKSRYNYDNFSTKNALKSINPEYLLDESNTDNH